jgi:hypothetical protein
MTHDVQLREPSIDDALADLTEEFAREFGALADVFESWRKPEVAGAVVEAVLNRDRDAFMALLEPGLDPRDPSDPDVWAITLCYKAQLLLEKFGRKSPAPTVETCHLRTDLSPDERRRYLVIALQFADTAILVEDGGDPGLEGPVVPPGPFLDALRAEGLVNCVKETVAQLDPRSGAFGGLRGLCEFQP